MFNVGCKNKSVKFVNFHVIKENDWLEQITWHATAMSRASSWAMLIDVPSVNNADILAAESCNKNEFIGLLTAYNCQIKISKIPGIHPTYIQK